MQYPEVIKTALEYIEQNLKTDITLKNWHKWPLFYVSYYRLFSYAGFFNFSIF